MLVKNRKKRDVDGTVSMRELIQTKYERKENWKTAIQRKEVRPTWTYSRECKIMTGKIKRKIALKFLKQIKWKGKRSENVE